MSYSHILYDPFTEFDKLFDDAFNARLPSTSQGPQGNALTHRRNRAFPKMDLHENAETKTVTATLELPGLKSEDVAIEVHGNHLTISGESKLSEEYEKGGYSVQERSYGKFSRSLRIPQGVQAEDVQAKMEHGLLTVSFPKVVAGDLEPKRIAIA